MRRLILALLISILPITAIASVFGDRSRSEAEQTISQRLETLKELIEIYEALPEALGDENGWARCREAAMTKRVKCHDSDKTDPFLCEIEYENSVAWCDMLNGGLPY